MLCVLGCVFFISVNSPIISSAFLSLTGTSLFSERAPPQNSQLYKHSLEVTIASSIFPYSLIISLSTKKVLSNFNFYMSLGRYTEFSSTL